MTQQLLSAKVRAGEKSAIRTVGRLIKTRDVDGAANALDVHRGTIYRWLKLSAELRRAAGREG